MFIEMFYIICLTLKENIMFCILKVSGESLKEIYYDTDFYKNSYMKDALIYCSLMANYNASAQAFQTGITHIQQMKIVV